MQTWHPGRLRRGVPVIGQPLSSERRDAVRLKLRPLMDENQAIGKLEREELESLYMTLPQDNKKEKRSQSLVTNEYPITAEVRIDQYGFYHADGNSAFVQQIPAKFIVELDLKEEDEIWVTFDTNMCITHVRRK